MSYAPRSQLPDPDQHRSAQSVPLAATASFAPQFPNALDTSQAVVAGASIESPTPTNPVLPSSNVPLAEGASIPKPVPKASSSPPTNIEEDVFFVSDRSPNTSPAVVDDLADPSLTEGLPSRHDDRQPSPPSVPVRLSVDSKQSPDSHPISPLDKDNSHVAALQENGSQDAGEFNSSMFTKFPFLTRFLLVSLGR
jgi:hypothetical protein